jgi:hypothetical protein
MTVLSKFVLPDEDLSTTEVDTTQWKIEDNGQPSTTLRNGRWQTVFEISGEDEDLLVWIDFDFLKMDSCCLEITCRVGFPHQPFHELTSCSGQVIFKVGKDTYSFIFGTPETGYCPMCSIHMWEVVRDLYEPARHPEKVESLRLMNVNATTPESIAMATFWTPQFKIAAVRRFLEIHMPSARFVLGGLSIRSYLPDLMLKTITRHEAERLVKDNQLSVNKGVIAGLLSKLNLHPPVFYNEKYESWFHMAALHEHTCCSARPQTASRKYIVKSHGGSLTPVSTTSTKVQTQNQDIDLEIAEANKLASDEKRASRLTSSAHTDPPVVNVSKPCAIADGENPTRCSRLKRERKRTEAVSASLNKKKSEHDRCFSRLTRMTKFAAPDLPDLPDKRDSTRQEK